MAVFLLVCSLHTGPLEAQITANEISAQDRDAMYEAVAKSVAQFEKQGSILKRVVQLVRPAVVHIEAGKGSRQLQIGQQGRVEEAGSGVIVRWSGKYYVLTNYHVVRYAELENITIKLYSGRELQPLRLKADRATDVAVMEIAAPDLVAARLGDSERMAIGDFVLAIGSPFGLSHSVTYGIVSAKGRHDLELGEGDVDYQYFIQTDAAINPGNSGGPLTNLRGEVIGINTAIASASGGNEGIGFAIPVNMVRFIARQLIATGTVSRAFLGVKLDSSFGPPTAQKEHLPYLAGTRVSGITRGSPAEEAGLQVGDVIIRYNGIAIVDDNHLVNVVGLTEIGETVPVVVLRDRKPVEVPVKVGRLSKIRRGE
ncbi:MAG: S1C family serine protease [Pirellulales bacterium]